MSSPDPGRSDATDEDVTLTPGAGGGPAASAGDDERTIVVGRATDGDGDTGEPELTYRLSPPGPLTPPPVPPAPPPVPASAPPIT
ncbi:MAG: hypothetical protein IRZ08_14175, partial [Frankia sp.]|nr:hypothetical protein [Frankia sp.]